MKNNIQCSVIAGAILLASFSPFAKGQTVSVTGTTTSGNLPVFSYTTNPNQIGTPIFITNSPLTQSANNIILPSGNNMGIGMGFNKHSGGTYLPQQPFHVVGESRFDIGQTTGAGGGRMFLTRTGNVNQECLLSFGTGPFATATDTYDWAMGTYASGTANNDWVFSGWTAGRVFSILQSNGNVGIGSSSLALTPPTKLYVGGDFMANSVTDLGNQGAAYITHTSLYTTATNPDYTWWEHSNTGIFHPSQYVIGFSANGTEAMRIGNGTNPFIGIANTNPQYPLDVTGDVHITGNTVVAKSIAVNNFPVLLHGAGDPAHGVGIFSTLFSGVPIDGPILYGYDGGALGTNHSVSPTGPTKLALNWYDNGNVVVNGGALNTKVAMGSANGAALNYGTSYLGLNAQRDPATQAWRRYSDSANNGAAIMFGDVFGNINFSPLPSVNGQNDATFADADVISNQTLRIRWNNNISGAYKGQVVIGNQIPGTWTYNTALLTVSGTIVAKEIWVLDQATANWADYVFNKAYKLMPLSDVDKYITENQHLPNVPNAKEVGSSGQNLGDLQVKQMEKIEELTLYIIELNKEVQALRKETEELRAINSHTQLH